MSEGNVSYDHAAAEVGSPDPPKPRVRRRFAFVTLVVGAVLVVALIIPASISVPYEAIVPGSGIDVATLITVPTEHSHEHDGAVLLTDVDLVPLNALNYYYYRFKANTQIISTTELTGGASNSQYSEQGVIDMANARQAATVVGLRALGYQIEVGDRGVVVYEIPSGSPATHRLAVGDVVSAVDGQNISSVQDLRVVLDRLHPGEKVEIAEHAFTPSTAVSSTDFAEKTKTEYLNVTLGVTEDSSSGGSTCKAVATTAKNPGGTACIGIVIEQVYGTANASFPVAMNSNGIVGPSAGLAFSLGLITKLDPASLTNGLRIAATGTMAINGAVGDVGGVAQKTIAVRAAGTNVFFVPPQELAVAKAHAGSALRVFAVSTLSQALSDLEHLGGQLRRGTASR